MNAKKNS